MLSKILPKKLLSVIFLAPFALYAQTGLVIDGDQLYMTPGASLYVNDSVLVINGGTINNNGDTVYLTGDWTNNSGGNVFTNASTGNVLFNGSVQQNIDGSSSTVFDGITINNPAGINLGVNSTVSGTLSFATGLITTTPSYVLALGASGNVTGAGAGSYVYGNFQKTIHASANPDVNFEIGDASVYAPLSLAFHGASVGGSVTANTTPGQDPNISGSGINSSKDVARYWTLSNNSITGFSTFDATFNYSSGDVIGGATPANFIAQEFSGGSWASLTISGTPSSTATATTGATVVAGDYEMGDTSVSLGFVWLGNSSDFSDNNNWANGQAPSSCADNIVIPATGNDPTISSSIQVGNITVNTGVNITNNATLSVCGAWTGGSSNTSVIGSGVVTLNGSSPQTVSGQTQFQELVTNNSAGISLGAGASISIMTALDLEAGNFNVSAGTITFLSTSTTQCAIIDNFSNVNYVGSLTGSIHAERYYNASQTFDQHFMGSPVDAPQLAQFGAGGTSGYVIPTPSCSETQIESYSPYGNVYSLHESHGATCGMAQWYLEPGSQASTDGEGYSVRIPGAGTLTVQGNANLNSGYQLTGLTNSDWTNTTAQGHTLGSGWQLVSNPYLATLQIQTADENIENQVQIWNTYGAYAGSYQPDLIGDDAVIPPFQAFMVKEDAPSGGTFTFHAGDRVLTPLAFFEQNDNQLGIVVENASTGLLDKTTVAFNSNATDGFDNKFDAEKFSGDLSRHTIYSLNNDKWMAINVLNSVSTTSTVPVGFEPASSDNATDYTFTFNGVSTFDPTTYIFLEDVQTGAYTNVRNGAYSFTSNSTDNWSRFVLHFTPPAVISTIEASCNAMGTINITQPGTANWNYQVKDNNNAIVSSGILNQNNPLSISAQAGTYTLTLVDNNNYTVTKSIVVGGTQDVTASFTMPSTVAVIQTELSFTSTSQNANNYSWNFGDGSTVTGVANPTHTYTTPGTYVVTLTVTNAAGCSASVSQTLAVSGATGIANVGNNDRIGMWSNDNRVYVDFTQAGKVDAVVKIFNILGQEISTDRFTSNTIYQKVLDQVDAAYVIVSVKNDDKVITKKLFIANTQY